MATDLRQQNIGELWADAKQTATRRRTRTRPLPDLEYQHDPIGWMRDVLGIPEATLCWSLNAEYQEHQWDGAVDPLAVVARAIAEFRDTGVESGTGTGKTFLGGCLAPWFLVTHENAIVVTTAPKEDQLTLHLFKELENNFPRLKQAYPGLTRAKLRLRVIPVEDDGTAEDDVGSRERWAIVGYSCGVDAATSAQGAQGAASKAKGFHAKYMLVVTEETQGIHPAVMNALENTCTGETNVRLAFGNPSHQQDTLHSFCQDVAQSGGVAVRISALDHPNVVLGREVIPGAVSRKSIEQRRVKYGENSPSFQSQVRGISPEQADDALIRLEWIDRAVSRYEDPAYRQGEDALGVDPANSEGGDRAAIAHGRGACLLSLTSEPCPDSNVLARKLHRRHVVVGVFEDEDDIDSLCHRVKPQHIGVDPIGVGAGTVNEFRRLGAVVQALNGGASPIVHAAKGDDGLPTEWEPDANRFGNLRSQMYWQAREDLRLDRVALPPSAELKRQLVVVRYEDRGGKIWIQPKDEIRAELGRSPDEADAFVYWNFVRPRAKKREKPNQTSAYDYEKQRPREQLTAEEEMARIIRRAQPHVLVGRYRVPPHRVA